MDEGKQQHEGGGDEPKSNDVLATALDTVDDDVDEFLKQEEEQDATPEEEEEEEEPSKDEARTSVSGVEKDEGGPNDGEPSAVDVANGESEETSPKMPWSLYKKSISQSKKGLVTGFDVYSEDEKKKREKRAARWGDSLPSPSHPDVELAAEAEKRSARLARFSGETVSARWILFESTSLKPLNLKKDDLPPSGTEKTEPSQRLFLQALDAEEFKRIRSSDIEAFFASHKPTYVEWLGDTTCNVWFEEKHTARRALEAFTVEIPDSTWRLVSKPLPKAYSDKWGAKGKHATRLVCRFATDADVLLERPTYHNTNKKKKRKKQYLTIDSTSPLVVGGSATTTTATLVEEKTTKDPLDAPLKSRRKTSHTTQDF